MRRPPTWIWAPVGAVAAGALAAAGLFAQAWYAVRKPFPSFEGGDISGTDGRPGQPGQPTAVVAAVGDSSLTGPGLDDLRDVWLRQATRAVAAELGCRIEIRSVAIGGSRVVDAHSEQLPALRGTRPDVTVLVLGPNDVIRVTSCRAFRRELRALIADLRSISTELIVGGVADVGTIPRLPPPLKQVSSWRSRTLDRVVREVAHDEGAQFVDLGPANANLHEQGVAAFCPDHFHCNAAGHAEWAALAVPALRRAIPDALARRGSAPAATSEAAVTS